MIPLSHKNLAHSVNNFNYFHRIQIIENKLTNGGIYIKVSVLSHYCVYYFNLVKSLTTQSFCVTP